jgi:hypothetical protein
MACCGEYDLEMGYCGEYDRVGQCWTDMRDLYSELNNIEDDMDTCSITAVNGDEVEPPCIYHPTLDESTKYRKEEEKQFERLRKSIAYARFKKRKEDEGPWQGWERIVSTTQQTDYNTEGEIDLQREMSGYDAELDDFISYLYVMSQTQIENDLFQTMFCDICGCNKEMNEECIKNHNWKQCGGVDTIIKTIIT